MAASGTYRNKWLLQATLLLCGLPALLPLHGRSAGFSPDPAEDLDQYVLGTITPEHIGLELGEQVTLTGSFDTGADPTKLLCKFFPAIGTWQGRRANTVWNTPAAPNPHMPAGTGPTGALYANMTLLNSTHAQCSSPGGSDIPQPKQGGGRDCVQCNAFAVVEGPGFVSVSHDGGSTWSNGRAFSFLPLASVTFARFPFLAEQGQLLVQTDATKLRGQVLTVTARLPCVPDKAWRWEHVVGGTAVSLPLGFDGVPPKVHNDMQINISLPDGRTIVHWRRFMRVPPPVDSMVEPVQLDHARAGFLVDGQPFMGRGFYMQPACPAINCTAENAINISGGLISEFGRLARTDGLNMRTPDHRWCYDNASDIDKGKKSYPCRPPAVLNWVMLYGFADWTPAEQIKVLDGAHRFGLKILYDLSRRGISSHFNGGPITNASGIKNETAHWLHSNISAVKDHPGIFGYYVCDDCCSSTKSAQALIYSFIKDIDPYHLTVGAVNCQAGFMFRDYPSEDVVTVSRSEVWMGSGQPALQLSLDVIMYENYESSLTSHAGTGLFNNSFPGPALGGDGNLRFGLFQEPVVNCDAMSNSFSEARGFYPDMAKQNSFPPDIFRSVLWMGALTANMLNQLLWLFGTDPVPYGPWQQTDMAAQWAAEVEELMPSLYGPFGVRDAVAAAIVDLAPATEGLAAAAELRVRSWQENANCCHVVLINTNSSSPARPTILLTGAIAGLQGGRARRLFDAMYSVPASVVRLQTPPATVAIQFRDWVAAGHTNVYRLGTNCSDTAAWRQAIRAQQLLNTGDNRLAVKIDDAVNARADGMTFVPRSYWIFENESRLRDRFDHLKTDDLLERPLSTPGLILTTDPPKTHPNGSITPAPPNVTLRMVMNRDTDPQYNSFRIPGFLVVKDTLFFFGEGRKHSCDDYGYHDLVCHKSNDRGQTFHNCSDTTALVNVTEVWGTEQLGYHKNISCCGGGISDPTPLLDRITGEIFVWFSFRPAQFNNPSKKRNPWASETYMISSTDEGLSFSAPVNMTHLFASSPHYPSPDTNCTGGHCRVCSATGAGGAGIQTSTGRLLVPGYHCDCNWMEFTDGPDKGRLGEREFSHIWYSDDHGKNWALTPRFGPFTAEGTLVELFGNPMRLQFNFRVDCDGSGKDLTRPGWLGCQMHCGGAAHCRRTAISQDDGMSWSEFEDVPTLTDPGCKAGLTRWDAGNALVFVNDANDHGLRVRKNITAKLSFNNGKSWTREHYIFDNGEKTGYATAQMLDNNTLGVMMEYKGCMLAFGHLDLRNVHKAIPPPQAQVISVLSFGAQGDESHDDRISIQAALDASSNCTQACIVLFPAGFTFRCVGGLHVRPSKVKQSLQVDGIIALATPSSRGDRGTLTLLMMNGVSGLQIDGIGGLTGTVANPYSATPCSSNLIGVHNSTDISLHGLKLEHTCHVRIVGAQDIIIDGVNFVGDDRSSVAVTVGSASAGHTSNISVQASTFSAVAMAVHVIATGDQTIRGLRFSHLHGDVEGGFRLNCSAERCTDFGFVNVSLGRALTSCAHDSVHGVVLDCNHGGVAALHSCVKPFTSCSCKDKSLCQPLTAEAAHENFAVWIGYAHNGEGDVPAGYPWLQPNDWRQMDFKKMTTLGVYAGFVPTDLICHAHQHDVRVVLGKYKRENWSFPIEQIGNSTARSKYIASLVSDINTIGADGAQYDIEGFERGAHVNRDHLTSLVAETRRSLNAQVSPSSQLSFCSHYKPRRVVAGYDFQRLAVWVDFFFIMEYGQCWGAEAINTLPRSMCFTSGQSLVESISEYSELNVSTSKLLVGFPWFGWDIPCNSSVGGSRCFMPPVPPGQSFDGFARMVPYSWALQRFRAGHVSSLQRDSSAGMAFFDYIDDTRRRQVIFDTPATYAAKYKLVRQHNVRGIGFYSADELDYSQPADVATMWGALPAKTDDAETGGPDSLLTVPRWPNASDGVHLFQVFDYKEPQSTIVSTAAKFDFVWGPRTKHVAAWQAGGKRGTVLGFYNYFNQLHPSSVGVDRMPGMQVNVSKEWVLGTHPEWLVYQCDRATPASGSAFATDPFGFPDPWAHMPLDLTSQPALEWMFRSMFNVTARAGFGAIAMDGFTLSNTDRACGVYRNGSWVQLYSNSTADAAYRRDVIDWVKRFGALAKKIGMLVVANLDRDIWLGNQSTLLDTVAPHVDAVLDEWGPIVHDCGNRCNRLPTSAEMASKVPLLRALQQRGQAYFSMTEWDALPPQKSVREWVVAYYMLIKGDHAFVYLAGVDATGHTHAANVSRTSFIFQPEFSASVGVAIGEPVLEPTGLWGRNFSRALTVLNPTKRTIAVELQKNCRYRTIAGRLLSGETVIVENASARVLLRECPVRPRLVRNPYRGS